MYVCLERQAVALHDCMQFVTSGRSVLSIPSIGLSYIHIIATWSRMICFQFTVGPQSTEYRGVKAIHVASYVDPQAALRCVNRQFADVLTIHPFTKAVAITIYAS